MEINGVAHTFLTSGNFSAARDFYSQLLPYLGMKPVIDGDGYYYCIGGKTGVGIRASERQGDDNRFDQSASGLHHLAHGGRPVALAGEQPGGLVEDGLADVDFCQGLLVYTDR